MTGEVSLVYWVIVSLKKPDSRSYYSFFQTTGVSKKWWKEAAVNYNWDVDINSIYTVDAGTGKEYARYNVVMRRRSHIV